MKRHIFGGICQVLFRKKWGDFNYEQRKSLEKSRLRIPRRYYINGGKIKKSAVLEIPDDVIQKILYDTHGKLLPDIKFNQWGISVYEKDELIKWLDFLKNVSEEVSKESKQYCQALLDFAMQSYVNNDVVLHFGI